MAPRLLRVAWRQHAQHEDAASTSEYLARQHNELLDPIPDTSFAAPEPHLPERARDDAGRLGAAHIEVRLCQPAACDHAGSASVRGADQAIRERATYQAGSASYHQAGPATGSEAGRAGDEAAVCGQSTAACEASDGTAQADLSTREACFRTPQAGRRTRQAEHRAQYARDVQLLPPEALPQRLRPLLEDVRQAVRRAV